MYRLGARGEDKGRHVRLLGSGTILREVEAAAELLEEFDVSSEVYSVTSFTELHRDGASVERRNMLNPTDEPVQPYVAECLGDSQAPVIAATDYVKSHAEQIRPYFSAPYRVLGTDGFGRSDSRAQLRHFFEVDRRFVALAALTSLAEQQQVASKEVAAAMKKLEIDSLKPDPRTV